MRKVYQFWMSVTIVLAMALMVSCEGPAGTAGVDGKDGMDGINGENGINGEDGKDGATTCATCHNETTDLDAKKVEFMASAHSMGTYYSRGGECSGCHSTEGFLARKDFDDISEIYDLAEPQQTPISCKTCHTTHLAYDESDWALTNMDAVSQTIFGSKTPEYDSMDFGDYEESNLCLQCHQARDRGNVPTVASTDSVSLNSHWGPHYGVQGNVLVAKAGVHIAGDAPYPESPNGHGKLLSNACIDCHMADGDHTLAVSYESCATCHESSDKAEEMVEDLHEEVHDMLFALGAKLSELGVMSPTMEEEEIVGYAPKSGKAEAKLAKAVYNYMVVYQDHSYGVHNPSYVKALLGNSLASLN